MLEEFFASYIRVVETLQHGEKDHAEVSPRTTRLSTERVLAGKRPPVIGTSVPSATSPQPISSIMPIPG
jgi:hypothetical protein